MDFRLIEKTREWMEKDGFLGDSDVVSLAGASKELIDGLEDAKELILKQIEISAKLHNASQVILLHHSDCGAYKNSYNFTSQEEEKEKQFEDMDKSERIIKERFPGLEVVKIWAEMMDKKGQKVEFVKR